MHIQGKCLVCRAQFLKGQSKQSKDICKICVRQKKVKESKSSLYKCPQCTFENPEENVQCVVCDLFFEHKLIEVSSGLAINHKSDIVFCSKCNRSNHISSLQQNLCFYCFDKIYENKMKRCSICGLDLQKQKHQKHQINCFFIKQARQKKLNSKKDIILQQKLQTKGNKQPFKNKKITSAQTKPQIENKIQSQNSKRTLQAQQNLQLVNKIQPLKLKASKSVQTKLQPLQKLQPQKNKNISSAQDKLQREQKLQQQKGKNVQDKQKSIKKRKAQKSKQNTNVQNKQQPQKKIQQQKEKQNMSVQNKILPVKKRKAQKSKKAVSLKKKSQAIKIIQPAIKIEVIDKKGIQALKMSQIQGLTILQKEAIDYMQSKSLKHHNFLRETIQKRILSLGYTLNDLSNLQYYIQNNAPIIIHIHIKHMQFFINDTHYRSQFQTNTSSGALNRKYRLDKEDVMFDKKYKDAVNFQRVKYGVVNFTNDPKGVKKAENYGSSYFLLKTYVRERCTLTHTNSQYQPIIATLKYSFATVDKMTDQQLKSALNASKALQQSSSVTLAYKQIQIHGSIQFQKDIQRVYVNKKYQTKKEYLKMVVQFCQKNKLEYEFI